MTSEEARILVVEAARDWKRSVEANGLRPRDLNAAGQAILGALEVLRLAEEHELAALAGEDPAPDEGPSS